MAAAIFFIIDKDFEKAATLIVAAQYRLDIDCRIAKGQYDEKHIKKDKDIINVFRSIILQDDLTDLKKKYNCGEAIETFENSMKHISASQMNCARLCFQKAKKQFVDWDRATPRKYDLNWINWDPFKKKLLRDPIKIDPEEKNRIIADCYRRFKYEAITEDPDFVKETGCSFNEESRIYTDVQHGFQFIVPLGYRPHLSFKSHLLLIDEEIFQIANPNIIGVDILKREEVLCGDSIDEFYQWMVVTRDGAKIQKSISPNGLEVIETRRITNLPDSPNTGVSNLFLFHKNNIYRFQYAGEEKGNEFETILQTFEPLSNL